MKMSRGKRNVLFAGVLSCAMLFGIGNTMAYFTENSVQTNVFTTGDLDIGLKEPDWVQMKTMERICIRDTRYTKIQL